MKEVLLLKGPTYKASFAACWQEHLPAVAASTEDEPCMHTGNSFVSPDLTLNIIGIRFRYSSQNMVIDFLLNMAEFMLSQVSRTAALQKLMSSLRTCPMMPETWCTNIPFLRFWESWQHKFNLGFTKS